MKPKAPASYADWHELYHQHVKSLGFVAHTYASLRMMGMTGPLMDGSIRSFWTKVRRIGRIEQQMHEAQERNDVTWREHSAYVDSLLRGDVE